MIGQKDTTAIAKDFRASGASAKTWKLSRTGQSGRQGHSRRQTHRVSEFGHAPQMTDPEGFRQGADRGDLEALNLQVLNPRDQTRNFRVSNCQCRGSGIRGRISPDRRSRKAREVGSVS